MRYILIFIVSLSVFSSSVIADEKECRNVAWKRGKVITVNSAMYHGTRIQLPDDLKIAPISSNEELWKTSGDLNQVMVKPDGRTKYGDSAVLRLFTESGYAYDLLVKKTDLKNSDICVKVYHEVNSFGQMGNEIEDMAFVVPQTKKALSYQQNKHEEEVDARDRLHADIIKKSVSEALRRYRYHIYTRYQWSEKETLISDVYDDGRWTYIRLNQSNAGLMAIESKLGGKTEIVEAEYDDSYGMYLVAGIYPEFKMKLNNKEIDINRRDFTSKGKF